MDKPEALLLADRLQGRWALHPDMQEAAAELRRLHAENELLASAADKLRMLHSEERRELLRQRDQATAQRDALLEALRMFVSCAFAKIDERGYRWAQAYLDQALPIARAAIKAVEEGK